MNCYRARYRQLELQVELVPEQVVHRPDLASPARARLVRLDGEPLIARLLVDLRFGRQKRLAIGRGARCGSDERRRMLGFNDKRRTGKQQGWDMRTMC
eukprot:2623722-Pleurochrysis_carterae.AAC.1